MRVLAFAALALLLSGGCAQHHAITVENRPTRLPSSCAAKPIHITIIGDSLARGWGARNPQHTFAARTYAFIQRRHPGTTMVNYGVPGADTDEIARVQARLVRAAPCELIIVVAGANDVQKYYTPQHFRRSYEALLSTVRSRCSQCAVVVLGLPDVALSRRIPWVVKPVIASLSKSANRSISQAAMQYHAAMVPLYALSLRESQHADALLSSDGIHPNDAGYAVMSSAAYPRIALVLGDRP